VWLQGNDSAWRYEWLEPAPRSEEDSVSRPHVNEIYVAELGRKVPDRAGIWVADFFRTPAPVRGDGGGRPYYPPTVIWVDGDSGMILDTDMYAPGVGPFVVQERLLQLAERSRRLPEAIFVQREDVAEALRLSAERLGIVLHVEAKSPPLEDVKANLLRHLKR